MSKFQGHVYGRLSLGMSIVLEKHLLTIGFSQQVATLSCESVAGCRYGRETMDALEFTIRPHGHKKPANDISRPRTSFPDA
ncbi:hypothetical protein Poly21_16560 [Allorhodopirellula heiligendammensis]|uniref:Uncharacterized protein n=1 Tax=Allorhodopirellula heiligendammensis TaxID=2714739 RepID=A0A5C6C4K5_9BACT|nr:hypothetical protein Poly21_16560 [Allorhodopirellula heiligendammensis]